MINKVFKSKKPLFIIKNFSIKHLIKTTKYTTKNSKEVQFCLLLLLKTNVLYLFY